MSTRRSETVTTPFGRVELHRWGDGGRPIVLLHAAATGPRAFGGLAERLAGAGWSCVAPALHGYGGSRVEGAATAVEGHVTVARWTVETTGARVLFGHSMGGLAALLAAARLDLDRLALFEPILFDALDRIADAALIAAEAAMVAAMRQALAAGRDEEAISGFVEVWNDVAWADLPEAMRARLTEQAPVVVADTQATGSVTLGADVWDAAPQTVLIRGDRSPEIASRMVAGAAAKLNARLADSQVVVLPGLGHMAPLTTAGPVADALAGVLAAPS